MLLRLARTSAPMRSIPEHQNADAPECRHRHVVCDGSGVFHSVSAFTGRLARLLPVLLIAAGGGGWALGRRAEADGRTWGGWMAGGWRSLKGLLRATTAQTSAPAFSPDLQLRRRIDAPWDGLEGRIVNGSPDGPPPVTHRHPRTQTRTIYSCDTDGLRTFPVICANALVFRGFPLEYCFTENQ